ncbi:hypothetical protein EU799_04820 [Corynebacterium silvaticum]|uniref:hypothetical protein n=1 Tax=Corynebacterium silvaticum TaxID=2320431 RepID=UPI001068A354|nr:hypothetical protein [Corynebacterium silvaticum]MBH5301138.1 hypothetical protein [Corynebacterium silvaticum]NOM65338.1 hypothetical protein [Corynebacterium silvaticum]TFA92653.1 hypothetical protein EU802_04635 [Corynebacterium silvaticum]TFA96338.1 hypothetical protein EU799_04820 [Corynebacterium silvaticum]TNX84233.1 hypothetical protein FIT55_06715 [Corynebacterium silvaticum]
MNQTKSKPQEQTLIVCPTGMLNRALKAAKTIAGNKDPYDVIQLRPYGEDGLAVCAVNDTTTFVASIETGIYRMGSEEDEVIEFPKTVLPAFIMATSGITKDSDVELLTGLHVAENQITITDETGIGLDIALVKVKRHQEPANIGDPRATITRVINQLKQTSDPGPVRPLPRQIMAVAKAASSMGSRPELYQCSYVHNHTAAVRIVAVTPIWAMSVLDRPGASQQDDEIEPESDLPEKTTLRVVETNPTKGIS